MTREQDLKDDLEARQRNQKLGRSVARVPGKADPAGVRVEYTIVDPGTVSTRELKGDGALGNGEVTYKFSASDAVVRKDAFAVPGDSLLGSMTVVMSLAGDGRGTVAGDVVTDSEVTAVDCTHRGTP